MSRIKIIPRNMTSHPLKSKYGDRLKGLTICCRDDRGCIDYTIYFTDLYWQGNSVIGGIKQIDEDQNYGGMGDQGGTDWKEGDDPAEALRMLVRILNGFLESESIERNHKHRF